ncbi:hypothetical protein [Pontibacillus salipaludis]|uniref:YczE/YyaS/YitT family protein n=1 Tax=Pontibacillus salipaludis TaxID=1697394 RepID=UPI0031E64B3B
MIIKRTRLYILGMLITHLGTALSVKSTIGAGFWSAFFVGASHSIGLTPGMWFALSQITLVFINAFLSNRQPVWLAFIPIIIESVFFDFWLTFAFNNVSLANVPLAFRIITFISALTIASFGISLYLYTNLPRSPVDQLFVTISERFRLSIGLSQSIIAATITLFAFLLGGPIGAGTAISVFLLGPFIQTWVNILSHSKHIKRIQYS